MVKTVYTSRQQPWQTWEEEMKKAVVTTEMTSIIRVETEPLPVPDIFWDVSGTVQGSFTDASPSSEKTEQQLVQLIDDTFP